MRKVGWALLALVLLSGCDTPAERAYLPQAQLGQDDGYLNRWFTRQFLTMNEPVLYRQVNVDYAVRVTRFTDEVDAVSVRIDHLSSGDIFSTYKKFAYVRAGDLNPRAMALNARRVTTGDFGRLLTEVDRQQFFSIPEQAEFLEGSIIWLVEVYDGKTFHAVIRPTMREDQPAGTIVALAGQIAQMGDLHD